jgi:hypothetical protein
LTKSLDAFGREIGLGDLLLLTTEKGKDLWAITTQIFPDGKIEVQIEPPSSFVGQKAIIKGEVSIRLPVIYDLEASKSALAAGEMPVPRD